MNCCLADWCGGGGGRSAGDIARAAAWSGAERREAAAFKDEARAAIALFF